MNALMPTARCRRDGILMMKLLRLSTDPRGCWGQVSTRLSYDLGAERNVYDG